MKTHSVCIGFKKSTVVVFLVVLFPTLLCAQSKQPVVPFGQNRELVPEHKVYQFPYKENYIMLPLTNGTITEDGGRQIIVNKPVKINPHRTTVIPLENGGPTVSPTPVVPQGFNGGSVAQPVYREPGVIVTRRFPEENQVPTYTESTSSQPMESVLTQSQSIIQPPSTENSSSPSETHALPAPSESQAEVQVQTDVQVQPAPQPQTETQPQTEVPAPVDAQSQTNPYKPQESKVTPPQSDVQSEPQSQTEVQSQTEPQSQTAVPAQIEAQAQTDPYKPQESSAPPPQSKIPAESVTPQAPMNSVIPENSTPAENPQGTGNPQGNWEPDGYTSTENTQSPAPSESAWRTPENSPYVSESSINSSSLNESPMVMTRPATPKAETVNRQEIHSSKPMVKDSTQISPEIVEEKQGLETSKAEKNNNPTVSGKHFVAVRPRISKTEKPNKNKGIPNVDSTQNPVPQKRIAPEVPEQPEEIPSQLPPRKPEDLQPDAHSSDGRKV